MYFTEWLGWLWENVGGLKDTFTIALGLAGVWFVYKRTKVAQDQLEKTTQQIQLIEQGQLSDRYSAAVEQLTHENVQIRLAGVFSLKSLFETTLAEPARDALLIHAQQSLSIVPSKVHRPEDPDVSLALKTLCEGSDDVRLTRVRMHNVVPEVPRSALQMGVSSIERSNLDSFDRIKLTGVKVTASRLAADEIRASDSSFSETWLESEDAVFCRCRFDAQTAASLPDMGATFSGLVGVTEEGFEVLRGHALSWDEHSKKRGFRIYDDKFENVLRVEPMQTGDAAAPLLEEQASTDEPVPSLSDSEKTPA